MKNKYKFFTATNIFFYVCCLVTIIIARIYTSIFTWIVAISSIFGMLSSKTAIEGKWLTFLFDAISYALYIIVCAYEKYYGEIILSCIIIVIHMLSLFEWRKHQIDNKVIVNKINNKELISSLCISICICAVYFIILGYLNTQQPVLNAISTIIYLLGNYYCFRRSVLQFYCWIGYEITFMSLWIISAVNGAVGSIIFLIGGLSELVYGIYGIYHWNKMKKEQALIKE